MPTFPSFDPASLPPYPEKPHKTGQARVNVDGKSQYLGKYGTLESHALYHMACARKLITGVVPPTRELREELSRVACDDDSRRVRTPTIMTIVVSVVAVAVTSGLLSHYLTKVSVTNASPIQMATLKPIIESSHIGEENSDIGELVQGGDNRAAEVQNFVEGSLSEMRKKYPQANPSLVVEKVKFALERMEKKKSERRQTDDTDVVSTPDRES